MTRDRLPLPFDSPTRTAVTWIFVPAVVMSLGWGLRGYIGGGPLGAMIPGALITLMLCQYLNYGARAAAVVVAFGTIGIGFGGEMTYGQTLGLLRSSETFWWGLTGTTLKGAVWGLLGGAMLGLGFAARHIAWRHLLLALACLLVGVIVGIHFINQPKLIYFSDPVNRPRDESWAGFLFGALAVLAYMRTFQPGFAWIPARFALYGLIGGGIGFGGGSLLLALRFHVPQAWHWLPYWKFMEFAFGLVLGAAFGRCAWCLRDRLMPLAGGAAIDGLPRTSAMETRHGNLRWYLSLLCGAMVVTGFFYGWDLLVAALVAPLREVSQDDLRHSMARVLLGFSGLGCLFMLLSRWSDTIAWQVAISVTIVAAAIDWQRDLLTRGEIDMPAHFRLAFVVALAAVSVLFVCVWQHRKSPRLMDLFLFAICVLMTIGYMTGLAMAELWQSSLQAETDSGGRVAWLWQNYRSEIVVHTIFTTLTLISVWAALRARKTEALAVDRPSSTQEGNIVR